MSVDCSSCGRPATRMAGVVMQLEYPRADAARAYWVCWQCKVILSNDGTKWHPLPKPKKVRKNDYF